MTAPTYDLNTLAGQMYLSGTLNMGGAGSLATGMNAFLGNDYQPTGSKTSLSAESGGNDFSNVGYNIDPMLALGDRMGYKGDASQLRGLSGGAAVYNPDGTITPAKPGQGSTTYDAYTTYANGLNDYLKDYVNVSGMSPWAGTDDPRQAASTLYRNEGNVLTPQGDPKMYHAREHGSWAQENQDAVMAALVLGGGFLGGTALAGMGAGAGSAAGAGAAAGGSAPAYMGVGTAGAGAAGEGLSGLSYLQSLYAGLPSYGQGALSGAAQGGISSALQGQNPLKGMAIGGLTGGLGAWGGSALAGATGMPSWAAKALVSSGTGGLGAGLSGGDWKRGALSGGLGSLAGSALSGTGLDGQIAGRLGGLAGNYAAGSILGGAGGGSGGVGTGSGSNASPSTGGTAATGTSMGLAGPQLGAASAQEKAWLAQAYRPVSIEAQKKKLVKGVLDELEEGAVA